MFSFIKVTIDNKEYFPDQELVVYLDPMWIMSVSHNSKAGTTQLVYNDGSKEVQTMPIVETPKQLQEQIMQREPPFEGDVPMDSTQSKQVLLATLMTLSRDEMVRPPESRVYGSGLLEFTVELGRDFTATVTFDAEYLTDE